jgi:predicted nucleotidyltransferase
MSTRATAAADEYIQYVHRIATLLHEQLQEQLVSVVLFGSAARGEAGSESDVDLLIVATEFAPFESRFDMFTAIDDALRASRAYEDLRSKRLGTTISPIPLTVEEVDRNPPILLDLVTDGLIVYDTDGFMARKLRALRKKLAALGARRVVLEGGGWYWDLKPDYTLGEVIAL